MVLGFAEEEMDVLWHEDVGAENELMSATGSFDDLFEGVFGFVGCEVGKTAVATKGDEVELAGVLATFEASRHLWILVVGGGERFVLSHECPLMR